MFGLPLPFPVPAWALKALAIALAALALLLIGRQWGAASVYEDWIEANTTAAAASAKIVQAQIQVSERVRTEYQDRVIERQGINQTIEREVISYVEGKPLTLACMLDVDWIRLHNTAAAGSIPAPAGRIPSSRTGAVAAHP